MENETGRRVVEAGALCERKNGRGVDTNRNWAVHWGFREKDYDPAEEYPGTRPFRCVRMHMRFTSPALLLWDLVWLAALLNQQRLLVCLLWCQVGKLQ